MVSLFGSSRRRSQHLLDRFVPRIAQPRTQLLIPSELQRNPIVGRIGNNSSPGSRIVVTTPLHPECIWKVQANCQALLGRYEDEKPSACLWSSVRGTHCDLLAHGDASREQIRSKPFGRGDVCYVKSLIQCLNMR